MASPTRRPKKPSTRSRSVAAKKGWATRERKARELEAKKQAAARKRAATLAKQAAEKARRSEAAKRGARKRKARERAQSAFESFRSAVKERTREYELARVRESWHRQKRELFRAVDEDVDEYLDILDAIAEETDTTWDIAYGPGESAA